MAPLPVKSGGVAPMVSRVLLVSRLDGGKFRGGQSGAQGGRPQNKGKHKDKSLHTSSPLNFSYFIIMVFKTIQD